jgi:hypothetical protein
MRMTDRAVCPSPYLIRFEQAALRVALVATVAP